MPYINLSRNTPADLVDYVAQINNNWDTVDSKMAALVTSGTNTAGTGVSSPTIGLEASNPSKTNDFDWPTRLAVWNGSAWRQQTEETWGAWTNITITAPFVVRTGFQPQLRISNTGMIECRGGVQNTAGASVWPTGMQIINSGQFASTTYASANTLRRTLGTCIPTTPAGSFSYASARVTPNVSNFIQIEVQMCTNGSGGGNYIMLDGLSWHRENVIS